ncbi:hypothetical protein [Hymenobacter weizhouensis]|uniref:hypothetical protein n=1 Tax=Hymenobacter sp. YIM 151500-1 TaxID=2987689 RepID=UPI0022267D3D|nr:hypothetical protein [Hymenobacter sp. YIM 151500-1]UYZ62970.1 hypothetical protein OIS53_18495 [Hymenobacter sp. YIM 151500-1]
MSSRFFVCAVILGLLGTLPFTSLAGPAQRPDTTVTVSTPFELPLVFYVAGVPTRLNTADSVARRLHRRHKIRTITKLQLREGTRIDSVEYTELDRMGNKILSYNPLFKARTQRQFDARGRITQTVQLPNPHYPYRLREEFNLGEKRYEAFRQPVDSAEERLIQSWEQRRGDTAVREARLLQPLPHRGQLIARIVGRSYTVHRDTIRLEVVGYDKDNKPVATESQYYIVRAGRHFESGEVSYARSMQALLDTSALARRWRGQGLSDAAIQLRATRWLRGQYLPETRNLYNTHGQLLRTVHFKKSQPPSSSNDWKNNAALFSTPVTSSSFEYTYDAQGRVSKEVIQMSVPAHNQFPARSSVVVTQKTYSPKGLLLTETVTTDDQKASRYEYRYTTF